MRPISLVVVHCTDLPFGTVEGIRRFHVDVRGWNDIGYHFIIENGYRMRGAPYTPGTDGKVRPGRPVNQVGAHAVGYNAESIGVCLVGKDRFSVAQCHSLVLLTREICATYKLKPAAVVGHGELDGRRTCPNFDVASLRAVLPT